MAATHGGKGSRQRTVDHKKFSDNWDLAFSPKKEPTPPIKDQDEENRDEI